MFWVRRQGGRVCPSTKEKIKIQRKEKRYTSAFCELIAKVDWNSEKESSESGSDSDNVESDSEPDAVKEGRSKKKWSYRPTPEGLPKSTSKPAAPKKNTQVRARVSGGPRRRWTTPEDSALIKV